MKKFFQRLILFLPIAFMIVFVNYWVDPAHLFRIGNGLEEKMAEIQLTGWNVAIPSAYMDYDERIVHKHFVDNLTEKREILSLGSSRVREIRSHLFKSKKFQNHAAAAATLEDFIAIYEMYHRKGIKPLVIIMGLDHWILDRHNGYIHWRSIANEYFQAAKRLGLSVDIRLKLEAFTRQFPKYFEIVSPAYFQASLKRFRESNLNEMEKIHPTRKTTGGYLLQADGSCAVDHSPMPVSEVRKLVTTKDDGVAPLTKIDTTLANSLEKFISSIQKEGTKIVFLLVPIHPITYQRWIKNKKGIIKAEKYFRELAHKKDIPMLGSYDPAKSQCDEKEFRDWVHPRPAPKNLDKAGHF